MDTAIRLNLSEVMQGVWGDVLSPTRWALPSGTPVKTIPSCCLLAG